eukprot:904965-Pelagomonas_calceolata.AAC.7
MLGFQTLRHALRSRANLLPSLWCHSQPQCLTCANLSTAQDLQSADVNELPEDQAMKETQKRILRELHALEVGFFKR